MSSRQRRFRTGPSRLPIRTVSYRPTPSDPVSPSPQSHLVPQSTARVRSRTAQPAGNGHHSPVLATVTADQLFIVLPIPPSINKHYATVNGRRLLSSAGRAYKTHVGQQVWIALAQSPLRASLMTQLQSKPLAFSIHFFFTTALRRDVDSGLKITQDAVCEGLGLNDNRIVEAHLYKHVDTQHPRIEVRLGLAAPPSSAR